MISVYPIFIQTISNNSEVWVKHLQRTHKERCILLWVAYVGSLCTSAAILIIFPLQIFMGTPEEQRRIYSLAQVTRSIQNTLGDRYTSAFWVKAEMNKLNLHKQSGHCYPELVEKSEGRVVAQMKSILWNDAYLKCDKKFQRVLKEPLRDGIKILFLAKIFFDPVYGLSLVIQDIDPEYTLGDLEREKQETIQKLIEEGIIDRNKTLPFPTLPQRIAIISVETSKGFADFEKVISTNTWGYKFFTMLFPAVLQGERSIESICYQLSRIKKVLHHFDAVAIIRGGGGDVGLASYNNYRLAREIALFPLPVVTGIGHATNETVSEMVANYNAITPTKLADHLLQHFHNFATPLKDAERKIHDLGFQMLAREKARFGSEVKLFRSVSENLLLSNHHALRTVSLTLSHEVRSTFRAQEQRLALLQTSVQKDCKSTLEKLQAKVVSSQQQLVASSQRLLRNSVLAVTNLERNVLLLSPERVLKRGYSITLLNGRAVTRFDVVKPGDRITTIVADGKIESTVTEIKNKSDE